ncbi:MAG TPA: hypothetical protein VEY30_11350 [Myxococcaceae bacterium]|nr:hypothetical protein [Myxococcaceae bacterium]
MAQAFQTQAPARPSAPKTDGVNQIEALKARLVEQAPNAVALNTPRSVPPPPSRSQEGTALGALNSAQAPGYYVRERAPGTEEVDHELAQAVEQVFAELKDLPALERVLAANDEHDQPIVAVDTKKGLSYSQLLAAPDVAGRFKVVYRVPYEALPLKRDRPLV